MCCLSVKLFQIIWNDYYTSVKENQSQKLSDSISISTRCAKTRIWISQLKSLCQRRDLSQREPQHPVFLEPRNGEAAVSVTGCLSCSWAGSCTQLSGSQSSAPDSDCTWSCHTKQQQLPRTRELPGATATPPPPERLLCSRLHSTSPLPTQTSRPSRSDQLTVNCRKIPEQTHSVHKIKFVSYQSSPQQ